MGRKSNLLKDYPDEALLEEVRRVAELVDKPVLTCNDFTEHSGLSADILRRRFGSWGVVLERAGCGHLFSRMLDASENHPCARHSDEDILEEIRRVAQVVGKPVLSTADYTKHCRISLFPIRKRFGSWRAGLERAGLSHMCAGYVVSGHANFSPSGLPDEVLLDEIRRVATLARKPMLLQADFANYSNICPQTAARRFGNWQAALERAGVGEMYCIPSVAGHARHSRGRWPDEMFLEELRRVAQVIGKQALTHSDFNNHSKVSSETIRKRFGSWHIALERAGIGHMYSKMRMGGRCRYPKEELLEDIRRVAGLVGKPILTNTDFKKHAKVNPSTILRRFGTWQAALKCAGMGHMYSRDLRFRYSDDDLLEEIRRVASVVGRPALTRNEFIYHSQIDESTLRDRFGSLRIAFERTGVRVVEGPDTRFQLKFTNEMLLEELRRVAQVVGKPVLTCTDFRRHSEVSAAVVQKRFGGWRAALEQAGLGHMCSGAFRTRHSDE